MKYYAVIKKSAVVIIVAASLLSMQVNSEKSNKREIKIALYDSISPSVRLLEKSFQYSYEVDKIRYEMNARRIGLKDVINGSLDSFDLIVIGASGRQYFHGLIPKWRENIIEFIQNGGGYVGICGGANMISRGYENPQYLLDYLINAVSLNLIDAYINDGQREEWQYLWKEEGNANIPLKNEIIRNDIFAGESDRYITYGGGPGLYGMEKARGIAKYAEEPMEIAPIHYWIWIGKWIPYKTIKTDVKGYYSAAETEYGDGTIVVFGPHPEIPPRINGSIKEFLGMTIYGIPRYVYEWTGGEQKNLSYNWWIVRRSVAYVCNLPLPPAEELCLYLYTVQKGEIEAYTENTEKVEFYVDNELVSVDYEAPFKIDIDIENHHVIKAIGYDGNGGEAWDKMVLEKD